VKIFTDYDRRRSRARDTISKSSESYESDLSASESSSYSKTESYRSLSDVTLSSNDRSESYESDWTTSESSSCSTSESYRSFSDDGSDSSEENEDDDNERPKKKTDRRTSLSRRICRTQRRKRRSPPSQSESPPKKRTDRRSSRSRTRKSEVGRSRSCVSEPKEDLPVEINTSESESEEKFQAESEGRPAISLYRGKKIVAVESEVKPVIGSASAKAEDVPAENSRVSSRLRRSAPEVKLSESQVNPVGKRFSTRSRGNVQVENTNETKAVLVPRSRLRGAAPVKVVPVESAAKHMELLESAAKPSVSVESAIKHKDPLESAPKPSVSVQSTAKSIVLVESAVQPVTFRSRNRARGKMQEEIAPTQSAEPEAKLPTARSRSRIRVKATVEVAPKKLETVSKSISLLSSILNPKS
jgi:hypothetical protein